MKRLQRECFTLSLLGHAVLLAALFLGTAFLAPPRFPDEEPITLLDFVPDRLVDEPVARRGGGQPEPPAPQPEPPAPRPDPPPTRVDPPPRRPDPPPRRDPVPPVRVPEPERVVEPVRQPEPVPEPTRYRTPDQIEVTLRPSVRRPAQPDPREQEEARLRQQRQEEARRALDTSMSRLQAQFRSELSFTVPGAGGASYANYAAYVRDIYDRAWRTPEEADSEATVRTRIVIARDGRVVSSTITSRSGSPALDRSVQEALDRVRNIGRPFPAGTTDQERTFVINFNLKARLGSG